MVVSGQLHGPVALPSEKQPQVPVGLEVFVGPRADLDVVEESLLSLSIISVPTELSRL
jgi:hypothetical protein